MNLKPLEYLLVLLISSAVFFFLVASYFTTEQPYRDLLITILVVYLVLGKITKIKQ
jgi:hypothetical protein